MNILVVNDAKLLRRKISPEDLSHRISESTQIIGVRRGDATGYSVGRAGQSLRLYAAIGAKNRLNSIRRRKRRCFRILQVDLFGIQVHASFQSLLNELLQRRRLD